MNFVLTLSSSLGIRSFFDNVMTKFIFVWLTRSVNHTMPWPKIFIPAFVTVNRMVVTWFTVVEDRLQSTLA